MLRQLLVSYFNPRTPLQSAMLNPDIYRRVMAHFNPRTPLQSAILYCRYVNVRLGISIHALRYRVRSQDIVVQA